MPTPEELLTELEKTRRFAVENIPWYRSRTEYHKPIEQVTDILQWPFIQPEVFRKSPWDFASSGAWPEGITFSSSTTGNTGRPRWHSHAESVAYANYLNNVRTSRDEMITLNIHPFDQGPALASPGETGILYVPLLNPWHYELILDLLRDGWRNRAGVHRVELIHSFGPGLRILTNWLRERDIDLHKFGVRILTGYGSIQPKVWRRRLELEWNAKYFDQFGLSEVKMSAAVQCQICDSYHFHRPIIAEVVHPNTGEPCSEGTGVLVLSELYPLAQTQLLLRYWTGDLVEIMDPCMLSSLSFKPRGRIQDSIFGAPDTSGLVVGSLQVGEVCAESPDVATTPFHWAPGAIDAGPPRFTLRGSEYRAEVLVELRFNPALFPEQAKQTCRLLRECLEREITGLARACQKGLFELDVIGVRPGTLNEPTKV